MKETVKKYRINEYLDRLTVKEHKVAMKLIPEVLEVAVNTFHNYRNIEIGERQDIPYEKVKMLEILFEINPGTLQNYTVNGKGLKALIKEQKALESESFSVSGQMPIHADEQQNPFGRI